MGPSYSAIEALLVSTTVAGCRAVCASLCALKRAMAMIEMMLETIWYQAGTKGFFVRSISHATTNCVVPPNIVTDKAYMIASPLDRTDFGKASSRNAYSAPIPDEK